MTKDAHHPLRDAPLVIYESHNEEYGCIGIFGSLRRYPVYVTGATFEETVAKGEELRETLLSKHEATYIARRKAALISKQKRLKRKKGS